ncbi:MAG: polyphenol oxidase family protein [Gemmatimonadota bacterium]
MSGFPAVRHEGWLEHFPWLVQGTTTRRAEDGTTDFDLRLFGDAPPPDGVHGRWEALRSWSGCRSVVHARQVHGAVVLQHDGPAPGLHIPTDCDGHATDTEGVLLAVSIADCVPVSVVDPERRSVALLHAGWRGTAEGILERGLGDVADGGRLERLFVHLGPSICGRCYEVGAEVFEALDLPRPPGPTPIDLRAVLADRAIALGIDPGRLSISEWCTRCEPGTFFSHRGGDGGRQVAFLGVRS